MLACTYSGLLQDMTHTAFHRVPQGLECGQKTITNHFLVAVVLGWWEGRDKGWHFQDGQSGREWEAGLGLGLCQIQASVSGQSGEASGCSRLLRFRPPLELMA